ncbi:MAG: PaaI family thioesterase [Sphingomonas sp.]|uniref:PaaI family thioesterase n=1 Tax=Sphingomonas sp. TaxID=28214 RepID=UPI001AC11DDC|nr:PaaI family thioesterase [Sphingomonas sp.]MBN8809402.1 PaaI family thioesterase [Sphingomonas sp.]
MIEDARTIMATRLLGSPAARTLGLALDSVATGMVCLRLPFAEHNVTEGLMIHGGVIATLADITAVAAAVSSAREPPGGGATSSLAISYLAPANGCALVATGRTLRSGTRQHVVRVEIADDTQRPIAEALVTVVLA